MWRYVESIKAFLYNVAGAVCALARTTSYLTVLKYALVRAVMMAHVASRM